MKLLGLIVLFLAGCSDIAYYGQAARGQFDLWWRERPVSAVLADPATSAPVRAQLKISQQARDFATIRLGLPENRSYRLFVDLGRPWAIWNVIATRPDSLSPHPFCPPWLGCMPYQGFFSESDARHRALALQAQGFETLVYGVPAYSTLGWFADPLLNTFLDRQPAELGGLIFHELTHQQVYVEGDTDFNESLASFVEEQGTQEWLQGQTSALGQWQLRRERGQQIRALVLQARQDLLLLYQHKTADWRAQKQQRLVRLRNELSEIWLAAGSKPKGIWFDEPLGNAQLTLVATYHQRVPAWRKVFDAQNRDWSQFWKKAHALAKLPAELRQKCLQDGCSEEN